MPKPTINSLASKVDSYIKIREQRLKEQKEVDELEAQEKALREEILSELSKTQATGIAGATHRVALVVKTVPQVKDWAALQTYIKRTGSFDLLQRRVSDAAIKERWDAGKTIPGVGTFTTETLSVHKL